MKMTFAKDRSWMKMTYMLQGQFTDSQYLSVALIYSTKE